MSAVYYIYTIMKNRLRVSKDANIFLAIFSWKLFYGKALLSLLTYRIECWILSFDRNYSINKL